MALVEQFEVERANWQKAAKKEKQRLALVHTFELEGLRTAHADQVKAAEKRHHEARRWIDGRAYYVALNSIRRTGQER